MMSRASGGRGTTCGRWFFVRCRGWSTPHRPRSARRGASRRLRSACSRSTATACTTAPTGCVSASAASHSLAISAGVSTRSRALGSSGRATLAQGFAATRRSRKSQANSLRAPVQFARARFARPLYARHETGHAKTPGFIDHAVNIVAVDRGDRTLSPAICEALGMIVRSSGIDPEQGPNSFQRRTRLRAYCSMKSRAATANVFAPPHQPRPGGGASSRRRHGGRVAALRDLVAQLGDETTRSRDGDGRQWQAARQVLCRPSDGRCRAPAWRDDHPVCESAAPRSSHRSSVE